MTKKNDNVSFEEPASDPAPLPSASPQIPLRGYLGGEEREYVVGEWAGHRQYGCVICQFDTLVFGQMREHLILAHSILIEEIKDGKTTVN